ncbi:MAG: hypothetical protein KC416_15640, partial [Myxococcales bacterium]|nr:hypothetical protein [Myxococcales bacterium]
SVRLDPKSGARLRESLQAKGLGQNRDVPANPGEVIDLRKHDGRKRLVPRLGHDNILAAAKLAVAASKDAKEERRRALAEQLRRRRGTQTLRPIPEDLRLELRNHARRVARLRRIQVLADAASDGPSVERANDLLTREEKRHDRALDVLLKRPEVGTPTSPDKKEENDEKATQGADKGGQP